MDAPRFLTQEEVIRIHFNQIELFGGIHGIRDYCLLDSALHLPQASFGSGYAHQDVFHMAAAYAYALIKNHPFLDGNKRTGTLVPLVFLAYNDHEVIFSQQQLFDLGMSTAQSKITQDAIAALFKKNVISNSYRNS